VAKKVENVYFAIQNSLLSLTLEADHQQYASLSGLLA
jgi:hypothetical protein